MKILVVDDGQLAINSLIRILCRVAPDCDYISAMTTDDALTWLRQGPMDAAFLNLEMPGMNGLALARMIQKIQPRCNLIVVTEHPEYALEALQIFVSGFLLKPANEADVRNVLENLRYPADDVPAGVKVRCFGNFEVFVGGVRSRSSAARVRSCWPIWWTATVPPAPTARCWPCSGRTSPIQRPCTAICAI